MSNVGSRERAGGSGMPVGGREGSFAFKVNPPSMCLRHGLPARPGKGGCIKCRKSKKRK